MKKYSYLVVGLLIWLLFGLVESWSPFVLG
jgi:hypothetical protein